MPRCRRWLPPSTTFPFFRWVPHFSLWRLFLLWLGSRTPLGQQAGRLCHLQAAHGASPEETRRFPDVRLPTASEALAHTLKLLYGSSNSIRELEALPKPRYDRVERNSLPICSQSKYLCQLHNLHNPIPSSKSSKAAVELDQSLYVLRQGTLSRPRQLADVLSLGRRIPKGLRELAGASVTGHPIGDEPSFVRVPQLHGHGGVFLPLRIRTVFSDFFHPSETHLADSTPRLWGSLKTLKQGKQPPAGGFAEEEANDEQKASSKPLSGDAGSKALSEQVKALRFRQVRRFFQVDAVPSAVSWLQRVVMFNRREGPLVLQTQQTNNAIRGASCCREDQPEPSLCGLCPLPALPRIQKKEGSPSLGVLEDADVLLLFRTSESPNDKRTHVCQVDEDYRPIAVCISLPPEEAETLYERRSAAFPDVVNRVVAYMVDAFAINPQTLPYFLTWESAWRKRALRRIHQLEGTHSRPVVYSVTQMSSHGKRARSAHIAKGSGEGESKAGPRQSRQHGRHHFFLTTPMVIRAVRRLYRCPTAMGLKIALDRSGGDSYTSLQFPYPEVGSVGSPAAGSPLTEIMLAAIEDTGWYLTESLWSRESEWEHENAHGSAGCATLANTYNSMHDSRSGFGQSGESRGVLKEAPANPFKKQKLLQLIDVTVKNTDYVSDYARCVHSTVGLLAPPTRPTPTACTRIMCVSDDDRVEAPMMLPTSKAVKWVAAQIMSKMADGREKSTVCMRGENGLQKPTPYLDGGLVECPSVDEVCYGRPCKNGGVPKYGVCICKPGTFGRNCEYWDTERNRRRYPNKFSYGAYSTITVLRGDFFAIPALIDGPQRMYFKPISYAAVARHSGIWKLPSGVAVDSETGAIYGTPAKTTKGCVPLAIEAQMHEAPHAAERTFLRLRVAGNLLGKSDKFPLTVLQSPHDKESTDPFLSTPEITGDSSSQPRQAPALTTPALQNPLDCEHYVRGDMR